MEEQIDCKPFVDDEGNLVFPRGCNEDYQWWAGGKKLKDILMELKVSRTTWQRYTPEPYPEELQKENYPLLGS